MRSMRRGTKEMDLILMRFAQARLNEMSAAELSEYEQFLEENDQDLYQWVSGQMPAPTRWQAMVGEISAVIGAGMAG
ncbi:succinate dehydrogenase assembly factor 2 [Aquicoccus sp. G2-2]|uniref:succinate dehydrogenase assembly factor 2 n=1 Tax=Aquicoccus sp. G2-2 TaxID=3092120 RepID=UPI002AE02E10|nr:succinate dehydrogenase assembly factor 2 [Aquicoccus sp. G2-2]MEA1112659.1 succinate dehydrogenase assembly factor 2 [Aquicoccus sp. G2-2]